MHIFWFNRSNDVSTRSTTLRFSGLLGVVSLPILCLATTTIPASMLSAAPMSSSLGAQTVPALLDQYRAAVLQLRNAEAALEEQRSALESLVGLPADRIAMLYTPENYEAVLQSANASVRGAEEAAVAAGQLRDSVLNALTAGAQMTGDELARLHGILGL